MKPFLALLLSLIPSFGFGGETWCSRCIHQHCDQYANNDTAWHQCVEQHAFVGDPWDAPDAWKAHVCEAHQVGCPQDNCFIMCGGNKINYPSPEFCEKERERIMKSR